MNSFSQTFNLLSTKTQAQVPNSQTSNLNDNVHQAKPSFCKVQLGDQLNVQEIPDDYENLLLSPPIFKRQRNSHLETRSERCTPQLKNEEISLESPLDQLKKHKKNKSVQFDDNVISVRFQKDQTPDFIQEQLLELSKFKHLKLDGKINPKVYRKVQELE